jgi:outer membrane protein assembly factor BamA
LEAEVLEGPRYRLAEIKFTGNHAFSADELRSKFPLKNGDLFSREKVANGLDSLHQVYASNGFIDFASIPNIEHSSDARVDLSVGVMEGTQYHVGKLEIFTGKDVAEKLRAEWELPEGAVFDITYVDKYIDRNRSLLPSGFQRSHVQIVRDCPNATVEIRLPLDAMDPRSQSLPKNSPCNSPDNSSK